MSLKGFTHLLLVLNILGRTQAAYASVLTDNLVAYWAMEEKSGLRIDVAGSNDLTDNNTVTQAGGVVGKAAHLTPADAAYLSSNNSALNVGNIDFTLAAWVNATGFSTVGENIIAAKWADAARDYALYYESEGPRRFRFIMGDGRTNSGSNYVQANSFGTPPTDTWLFILGWHDASDNTLHIQINNGPVDMKELSLTPGIGGEPFRIGARHSKTAHFPDLPEVPSSFWDGRIDEVGVWKRTLTVEERSVLYHDPECLHNLLLPPSEAVIPEPPSLLLLGSGLLGLAGARRRFTR